MQRIKIDPKKCTGCRQCEMACCLNHKMDTVNPRRARIRIYNKNGHFLPVIAGPFADAACNTKAMIETEFGLVDMCIICRASCPHKTFFFEPDTGIPLKCDFCGTPPNPTCVKVCNTGALELIEVSEDELF